MQIFIFFEKSAHVIELNKDKKKPEQIKGKIQVLLK